MRLVRLLAASALTIALFTSIHGGTGSELIAPVYAGTSGGAVAGPIVLSAALNTDTCAGGPVTLSASVTDANGAGVQGAMVSGSVKYKTTGHAFTFPVTDLVGNTSTRIDTGQPRGGYNVVFTVDASVGSFTGEIQTTCYAP